MSIPAKYDPSPSWSAPRWLPMSEIERIMNLIPLGETEEEIVKTLESRFRDTIFIFNKPVTDRQFEAIVKAFIRLHRSRK